MQEQTISFETSVEANKNGFNEYVQYIYIAGCKWKHPSKTVLYNNSNRNKSDYSAPTQGLLQKWLREIHNINAIVTVDVHKNSDIVDYIARVYKNELLFEMSVFKTYEEALEKALEQGLQYIKVFKN